jgi:transitional endoplasmic reticulum ATPase
MTSNVAIEEVQPVNWNDLKGLDDVIEALEAKIALPFENSALAAELDLKPKRGVLLAGPPGTGKTTIGRALAHRLKGKFFLIDGTVVAEGNAFYDTLRSIFDRAKKNAPSVIFIDDTDLIFENNNRSFYRFLLTMLDGLESASAERVCVMMTAMEVSSIPAAMLRSGRVELWLETRLPDAAARAAILGERLLKLPPPIRGADTCLLASASRGLTGADLKAIVEDGKLLFAHDKANGKPFRAIEDYFLDAIRTVRANRRSYARSKPARPADTAQFGFAAEQIPG